MRYEILNLKNGILNNIEIRSKKTNTKNTKGNELHEKT